MIGCRPDTRAVRVIVWGLVTLCGAAAPARAQTQAESLSASFRKAAGRVAPAIVAVRPLDASQPLVRVPLPPVVPLQIREILPRAVTRAGEFDGEPFGTGLVIDVDRGYVLTCDHVLRGSSQAVVALADGRERYSSQIRRDPRLDLALLVVDLKGLNLARAEWGDAGSLQPGDWVVSIGQPAGSAPAISAGIVSAVRPGVGIAAADDLIETDARVNPLNSGGPLVNLKGEVVGINLAPAGRRGALPQMGYAVPGDRARRVAGELGEFGRVRRAFLGVRVERVGPSLPDPAIDSAPLVIVGVNPGSPAAEAGLKPGDRIVSIGGRPIAGVAILQSVVELAPIGEALTVAVDRGGQRLEVKVRARAQPAGPGSAEPVAGSRIEPEPRRDATHGPSSGRDRGLTPPTAPVPLAPSAAGEPSSLDPIPERDRSPLQLRPSRVPPNPSPAQREP
jgi:serine protease Do